MIHINSSLLSKNTKALEKNGSRERLGMAVNQPSQISQKLTDSGTDPHTAKMLESQQRLVSRYVHNGLPLTAKDCLGSQRIQDYKPTGELKGGTIKIPFRPGMTIGSVMSQVDVLVLKQESVFNETELALEQSISTLNNIQFNLDADDKKIPELITEYESKLKQLKQEKCEWALLMATQNQSFDVKPTISSTTSGARFRIEPRGSETSSLTSMYFHKESKSDASSSESSGSKTSSEVSLKVGKFFGSVTLKRQASKEEKSLLEAVAKEQSYLGSLSLNYKMTSKQVKVLEHASASEPNTPEFEQFIKTDKSRCEHFLTLVKERKESIKETLIKDIYTCLITDLERIKDQQSPSHIHYLSEAVLGGTFIGMIHFFKSDQMTASNHQESSATATQYAAKAEASFMGFKAGGSVSRSRAYQEAAAFQEAITNSGIMIKIDCITQGALADIKRQPIKTTLTTNQQEAKATQEANEHMALVREEKEYRVHQLDSLYEMFENFVDAIRHTPDSGIPISFTYRTLPLASASSSSSFNEDKVD